MTTESADRKELLSDAEFIQRLQVALAFWLPHVPPVEHPLHDRVADDAFLLVGLDSDEQDAEQQGWIALAAERQRKEAAA